MHLQFGELYGTADSAIAARVSWFRNDACVLLGRLPLATVEFAAPEEALAIRWSLGIDIPKDLDQDDTQSLLAETWNRKSNRRAKAATRWSSM